MGSAFKEIKGGELMLYDVMGIVAVLFAVGITGMELFEGNYFFHS
jgi:hypothetical protein